MSELHLHHRPALMNRISEEVDGKVEYYPPANSPDHLVYLPKHDHDIETRVRGVGAQFSDHATARRRKAKIRKAKRPKRKWPSRPFNKIAKGLREAIEIARGQKKPARTYVPPKIDKTT